MRRTGQALQHEQLGHGSAVGQQRGQVQLRDAHRPFLIRRQHVPMPLRVLDERLCTSLPDVVASALMQVYNHQDD